MSARNKLFKNFCELLSNKFLYITRISLPYASSQDATLGKVRWKTIVRIHCIARIHPACVVQCASESSHMIFQTSKKIVKN